MRLRDARAEAADLLACLASQPDDWPWTTVDLPGRWSRISRDVAYEAMDSLHGFLWRERYAEAEAGLRAGAT